MGIAGTHNFSIPLDGIGTGEGQSADDHVGHAGDRLHEWMFATRWWPPDGGCGVDDAFIRRHDPGIGAEIMGARNLGCPGWHKDPDWKEGGTTFHFIDASPAEALDAAREAAAGQDVRLGGGATTIRAFLSAGLVGHMHVVMVPILLGRGIRLGDGLEGLERDCKVETVSSPSGVTHVTFMRVAA